MIREKFFGAEISKPNFFVEEERKNVLFCLRSFRQAQSRFMWILNSCKTDSLKTVGLKFQSRVEQFSYLSSWPQFHRLSLESCLYIWVEAILSRMNHLELFLKEQLDLLSTQFALQFFHP